MSSGHYCDGCAQAYYKCVCNKPQEKVKEQTIKMNERIKELAKQAGIEDAHFHAPHPGVIAQLERFAALVEAAARADERGECVKVAGDFAKKWWSIHCDTNKHMETTRKAHDDFCALQAAIAARGTT